jgi:hypothetical protein
LASDDLLVIGDWGIDEWDWAIGRLGDWAIGGLAIRSIT